MAVTIVLDRTLPTRTTEAAAVASGPVIGKRDVIHKTGNNLSYCNAAPEGPSHSHGSTHMQKIRWSLDGRVVYEICKRTSGQTNSSQYFAPSRGKVKRVSCNWRCWIDKYVARSYIMLTGIVINDYWIMSLSDRASVSGSCYGIFAWTICVCLSVCVCPQSLLWQNGWLDTDTVSGGDHW